MRHSRWLVSAFFCVSLSLSAFSQTQQPWSNILSPGRATNWGNAGLPASFTDKGGSNVETTLNPWTPPTRAQYGSTILPSGNAATDLSNINTALSNCSDGQYVLLGPGTFLIQGTMVMYQHSCTLRGSGAQSTILNVSGSSTQIAMGSAWAGGSCILTSASNYVAGSTSVTCAGNAPPAGSVVALSQCDTGFSGPPGCATGTAADNGGLFICGNWSVCDSNGGSGGANASQQQNLYVKSVTGSGPYTVTFSTGLLMPNWSYAQGAFLMWDQPQQVGIGVGIEDLTDLNGWINMSQSYASWVKGVRFIAPYNTELSFQNTLNDLVFNNYFFVDTNLDSNYAPAMQMYTSTSMLILNNIMIGAVEPWEGFGGNAGNVFAYNLGRDGFTAYTLNTLYDHHAYSSFDLFEGNQMGFFIEDDTWGTHDLDTYYRNYASCFDPPYSTYSSGANSRGMGIGNYQRFENFVGNAIGTPAYCSTYSGTSGAAAIFQLGNGSALTDSLVTSTLLRWGNVSVAQQSTDTPANSGIRFVTSELPSTLTGLLSSLSSLVPTNTSLPCSFFLAGYNSTTCTPHSSGGTGLSWWKVCKTWTTFPTVCAASQTQPFPLAGPDVSSGPYVNGSAYDTPASVAWQNLPVDTTYQNSYSITGSSWSSKTETLTISGLPSGSVHIMGAFQLSGVNSACTSGATFNANSEILMTGSSSTTVQYALAANPGISCTGTMKFPDVRQFDERVYGNDSAQPPTITVQGSVGPQS